MARSQNSFIKQQKEKRKKKKKEEKLQKKQERKENSPGGDLGDMLAYVDEFGNISTTPPSDEKPSKNKGQAEPDQEKSNTSNNK